MTGRTLQTLGAIALVLGLVLTLASCGDSGASQEEIEQARKEGIAKARQQEKIKDIEKQLKSLKKNGNSSQATPPTSAPSTTTSGGTTSCGGTLSVGPSTTCGFAANVQADYYNEIGSGSGTVYSYSPTTEQWYTMSCSAGSPHVCTGGNNASVYFP